jgi:hypothetical protein
MDKIYIISLFYFLFALSLNIILFFILLVLKKNFLIAYKISSLAAIIVYILFSISLLKTSILFYIFNIFIYLNLNYIFLSIIYTPKSSIRFKILKILIEKNFIIEKSQFKKIYNDKILFNKRIFRLLSSKTIVNKKNFFMIKNKKIIYLYFLFLYTKKMFIN